MTVRMSVAIELRHVVYSAALDLLALRPDALQDLTQRGLSPEAALRAGYRSLPRRGKEHQQFIGSLVKSLGEDLLRQCPGFTDKNDRLSFWTAFPRRDGYIVPYRDECGFITGLQAKVLGGSYLSARGACLPAIYHRE